MDLEKIRKRISEFEKKAGFSKTKTKELVKMLQKEVNILKKRRGKKKINHQLADILVLLMQISNRTKANFSSELKNWFEKSKKYIEK